MSMNRAQRRAARAAQSATVQDAAHRECDRLLKAIEKWFDEALHRGGLDAMHAMATIAYEHCICVMPLPIGEKPTDDVERRLNVRHCMVLRDVVIADFRDKGDEETARTLEQIGREKLPVIAYVPVHETLTQCAVGCIECRVLSPGGSA